MEIFSLLKKDHDKVKDLFERLEKTTSRAEVTRNKLFSELEQELTIHAALEEELFYPALENNDETRDLVLESYEEHQIVKQLLEEMATLGKDQDEWEAKLTVLKEMVEHHVQEEEKELFPKARKVITKDEANDIGEQVQEQKQQMLQQEQSKQKASLGNQMPI